MRVQTSLFFEARVPSCCQSPVETLHRSLTKTFHQTATLQDNHIEYLRLLRFCLVLYVFLRLEQ